MDQAFHFGHDADVSATVGVTSQGRADAGYSVLPATELGGIQMCLTSAAFLPHVAKVRVAMVGDFVTDDVSA